MKTVILAAGGGKRMQPLTSTLPKVMLPIANRPFLEHLLIELKQAGMDEFIFIVGYRADSVRNHFGNGSRWGVSIEYCDQHEPVGTSHAVKLVREKVKDRFMLVNGDVMLKASDFKQLKERKAPTISLFEVQDATGLGVVEIDGDRVIRIHEKASSPPSRLANAGAYLLTSDIFDVTDRVPRSPRGEYELPDAIQMLIDNGTKVEHLITKWWLTITYPWDLLVANEELLNRAKAIRKGLIEPGAVVKGKVSIGKGTIVHSGSYIIGPVTIGEECEIGPNCYIRPTTSIGNRCHIGASVEVKNSIIMDGSKIPHLSYVGDSIIGLDCNLGAGTKIANLKLDGSNVIAGGVETGRRKFGAVIGHGVHTGINVNISPGTIIGSHSHIWPDVLIGGEIPPGSTILERRERWVRSNRQ
ncbi:MAG: sugar phosphate nucleotidyltransferase [Dehalococcoidia bacterium]|nr:sugar phosphate nucleotidyltransferase [Dehalococcoidia bacterium]